MRIYLHDPFIVIGMVVGILVCPIQFLLPEWLFWCLTVLSLGLCAISIKKGNHGAIPTLIVLGALLVGIHLGWINIPEPKHG